MLPCPILFVVGVCRKLRKAYGKAEWTGVERLRDNKPGFKLDHIIRKHPTDVDYRVMATFTEMYTTLLGFINFSHLAKLSTWSTRQETVSFECQPGRVVSQQRRRENQIDQFPTERQDPPARYEDYFIGVALPPHLSPFVEEKDGDYVPQRS
ncbi:hypothetical protein DPEC_G00217800 [Dallia pectoralis]|uniref:Uncharacterized protein n=1 Tax=Dallia pectoralis TaxID=75939 RepID=A0ACC2G368_DALPE|nr:hypothetical protein DPEC_G00217800 [Dallia pectoralis]